MRTDHVAELFDRDAHNPSFRSIETSLPAHARTIDFCVPVNEYFPPKRLLAELSRALPDLVKFYPDYADVHQKNLANFAGLPAENIIVANGSTELITLLCLEHDGPLTSCAPTFGRWTDLPAQRGSRLHLIERQAEDQFELTVDRIVQEVRESGSRKLVLSNPNNPTGAANSLDDITQLVDRLSDLDLIVIDESFIDFSDIHSAAPLAITRRNVMVVKSLGKSLGWHGIRLGYAVSNIQNASRLRSRVPYWNVNGLAAFVLEKMPSLRAEYARSFKRVKVDRAYLLEQLRSIKGLKAYESQANFVYVRLPHHLCGKQLRNELLTRFGLLVRECSNKLRSSGQYLRIAVQRKERTDTLVSAITQLLNSPTDEAANADKVMSHQTQTG